ncbi:MAG: NAD(P)/FAD-dependent oxidoreductase [Acidobacteria bacterium]|nr:NAD(P)/FAD-dependent oxidoreductase [Acidobacteriota bacterium]
MRIGIIGARLAGSYAAVLLSNMGHEVLLFDDGAEKEKPCGGGVTSKVLRKMPWLKQQSLPYTNVATVRLATPDGYTGTLSLTNPIHVYPRPALDAFLKKWAVRSGVHFVPHRARRFVCGKNGWAIETTEDAFEADFLIGADGATSSVRASLLKPYSTTDLTLAIGYKIPDFADPATILIGYQEKGFVGYIWSFPCLDHTSVGIGQWLPGARSSDLRKRLDEFIAVHHPNAGDDKKLYAARIPCLSRDSLLNQRVCGEKWALLGDAAGFTDGITAEGIYYALRSAELLAEAIRHGTPQAYETAWRREFLADLETAARWRDRFYSGTVLSKSFIRRSLQAVRHSRTARELLDNLICGSISYRSLFRSLVLRSPQILTQAFSHRLAIYD